MKLYCGDGQVGMFNRHNDRVIALGGNAECVGKRIAYSKKRMITRRPKLSRQIVI